MRSVVIRDSPVNGPYKLGLAEPRTQKAFDRGEYDHSFIEGQHVIAHELAHVRRQTDRAVSIHPKDDLQPNLDTKLHLTSA